MKYYKLKVHVDSLSYILILGTGFRNKNALIAKATYCCKELNATYEYNILIFKEIKHRKYINNEFFKRAGNNFLK